MKKRTDKIDQHTHTHTYKDEILDRVVSVMSCGASKEVEDSGAFIIKCVYICVCESQ